MNHHEAREAIVEFMKKLPSGGDVSVTVNEKPYGDALGCTVWPLGITKSNNGRFRVTANEYEDLLKDAENELTHFFASRAEDVVRNMALKIIDISNPGPCTDRELRLHGFSDDEIAKYGDDACEKAAEMGGNSPFTIERTHAANAA